MANDPFQKPPGSPFPADSGVAPAKYRDSVDHMQAINFVFENPNWLMNILWIGLALLSGSIIPIVGQLVIHGYQFAIIESLHLRPQQTYPDFDFDQLGDYLMTGVWVFLVTLLVMIITLPITFGVLGLLFLVVVGGAAAGGEEAAGAAMLIVMPIFIILAIFFSVVLNMVMVPFVLRAGLTRDFGKAFDFGFAMQFLKNTWMQMIVSGLVFLFAMLILEFVGLLMACVGVFFTIGIGMMMQAHLGMQLYEVHLARGGDPIPIKPQSEAKAL